MTKNILLCLRDVYHELNNWGEGSGAKVASAGRRAIILYSDLSLASFNRDQRWIEWRLCPKMHLFVHCIELQCERTGNPKDIWCYLDEDQIGQACLVLQRHSHASTLHRHLMDDVDVDGCLGSTTSCSGSHSIWPQG